jgi:hypothetical protein
MRWTPYLLAALWVSASGPVSWACNTPVYRYAMYNWPVAPYRVFYLHEGVPPKDDLAVNRLLEEAGRTDTPLNVKLEAVDVTAKERFAKLPEVVRKAWEGRPAKAKSLHAVFNTHGQAIYAGQLDPAAVKAMTDSPARRRLGALLEQGNAGVLVLMASTKADQTRKAEQAIDDVLRRVAAGEIATAGNDPAADAPTGTKAGATGKGGADDDAATKDRRRLTVGRMTISRSDPAETWFVRSLLAVEDDLGQYAEEPMVFAVYGRARAMPPFVGKGITGDNLAEGVAFLAGACSCVIKDENPGVDLLVRWNWDATSEKLSADEPDPSPDGLGYREITAETPKRKPVDKPSTARPSATDKAPALAAGQPASVKADAAPPSAKASASVPNDVKASPVSVSTAEAEPTPYVRRQLRTVLTVLAVAAVLVFTVGMIWVRRTQAGNS